MSCSGRGLAGVAGADWRGDVASPSMLSLCPASPPPNPPQWVPEVRHFCPDVPILLVGMKTDLRNDPKTIAEHAKYSLSPITFDEAAAEAKEINAYAQIECSALENEGVQASKPPTPSSPPPPPPPPRAHTAQARHTPRCSSTAVVQPPAPLTQHLIENCRRCSRQQLAHPSPQRTCQS